MEQEETVSTLFERIRALERSGEVAVAIRQARQALRQAKSQGDAEGEASADVALAYVYMRMGHYPEARRLCLLALDLAASEAPTRAQALLQLGSCASETDDLPAAEEYFRQAVDLSCLIGCDNTLVGGLHNLSAGVYAPRGQFALSLAADEECLKIIQKRGMPEYAWGPLTTMNWNYWLMGQRQALEKNLPALRQAAEPGSIAEGYWFFIQAALALEAGEIEVAGDFLTQLRASAQNGGLVELGYLHRLGMSRLNRRTGKPAEALAWADDTLSIANRIGYCHLQGQALIERGRAAWGLNDLAAAEADFRAAMAVMSPLELHFDIACATLFLAALLFQQKSPQAPVVWSEAADRITRGGFVFLVDQERSLALPLLAAFLNSPEPGLAGASQNLLEHLQRVPPALLRVTTLGSWEVWVGGRLVEKPALRLRKGGELLALLLMTSGHSLACEQVLEALWPEREPEAALARLHQATSALRRALEPELPEKFPSRYLNARDGQISLNLPPGSQMDFERFEQHCRSGEWAAALALYKGDFLPHYLYAAWTALPRQQYLALCQQTLLGRGRELFQSAEFFQALEFCRRLLALDPWQEQAVLLGMHACLGLGDRSGARRLYRNLEKALREDLDTEPQIELQAYYRSLAGHRA